MVVIWGAATAAVITAGAYLRWACVPLGIAYWAGKHIGRQSALKGR